MEGVKRFSKDIVERMKKIVSEGSIMEANEISANLMVGSMILIILVLMLLCLGLNEIGLFTADKWLMRYSVIVTMVVEIPVLAVSLRTRNEPKWVKYVMELGCIIMCANMSAVLTHNVVLVTILPVLLSIRYYDEKFSGRVALVSILAFTVSSVFSVRYGILNLNVYHPEAGSVLTVETSLRQAVLANGVDYGAYLKSYFINDYLPRFIVFSVIATTAVRIALRGRQMIDLQISVSEKTGRLETELDLATKIQTGMLPCIFPAFPEHKQLELYATNIPAKEVGGDFYDYFIIDDDHVAVVMADVSGKGVGAALFMTISKIVLKNQLLAGFEPGAAMTNANRQLCENNEAGLFVTTWAGVYEVSTGTLKFTNAGHNPPVIRRKGRECEYLEKRHGFVLAGYEGSVYEQSEIKLAPGDELFLYTDGVTEATNPDKQLYGEDRLLAVLDAVADRTVKQEITDVKSDIDLFAGTAEQFDDITMLGIRILE